MGNGGLDKGVTGEVVWGSQILDAFAGRSGVSHCCPAYKAHRPLQSPFSIPVSVVYNWRVWFLEPQGNWSRLTKANPSLILETQFKEHAFQIKMSQQLQRKSDSAQPKVPPSPGNLTSQCDACLLCQRQSHLYQYLIWHEYCTLPMFYTIWRGLS